MMFFAAIAGLVSVVIGWIVTVRLFSLARRNQGTPERLLAMGFGGLFCVGYPFAGASRAAGLEGTVEGSLFFALGAMGMATGIIAFGRFPRVVFRPGSRWAGILAAGIGTIGTLSGIACAVNVAFAQSREAMIRDMQLPAIALTASIGMAFAWNGLESARYYRIMKRRLALGLARADTTHRFLLWAIASLMGIAPILAITIIRASGKPILAPIPMSIIAGSSLITSTCWTLAFFMPERYRNRFLAADPESASEAS